MDQDGRLGTVDEEAASAAASRGGASSSRGRGARAAVQHDERLFAEREQQERDYTGDRELTDAERLELFDQSLAQAILPDLPPIDGYHVCWLTTTNRSDSIQWRRQLGYSLIRVEEFPGLEGITIRSGDYAGIIGVNEMVAAKIPLHLYNAYMRIAHERQPLQQEEKLRAQTALMKQNAEQAGSFVQEGDGTANIVQRAKPMPELHA